MTYLLDTNTCIVYLNRRSENLRRRMETANEMDICLCAVVAAELFYGVSKSADPQGNLAKLEQFISRFPVHPFALDESKVYGDLRAALERLGQPIGPNDLMIAATAIARDATLVTSNLREFCRVKGLNAEDWTV